MPPRAKCYRCMRPISVCYCHTLRLINNQWPVHILQHPHERSHAIGTAGIASLSLTHCHLHVGKQFDLGSMGVDLAQAVLLYPSKDAVPIDEFENDAPRQLIFLDSSWRKSYRILMESPVLQTLPTVSLDAGEVSRYRIRKSNYEKSLSTLEAIVYTLGCLEKNTKKYESLLDSMDWVIDKQISLMGEEVFKKNYGSDAAKNAPFTR